MTSAQLLSLQSGARTCTMVAMSMGSMDIGKRRMLKSDSDTNAFSASRMLCGDDITYTANVVRDT